MDEPIPEYIIDRAVEIWKRLLREPKYDAIGDTGTAREQATLGMASMLARMIPSNATDAILDGFGAALKSALMVRVPYCIGVDYGPDKILADAAKSAGLRMEFPWKTRMWLSPDHIEVASGYGSTPVSHYRLPDRRWVTTTLRGCTAAMLRHAIEDGDSEYSVEAAGAD